MAVQAAHFDMAFANGLEVEARDGFGRFVVAHAEKHAVDDLLEEIAGLFGAVSDKCKSRRGRRTPFIIFGTVAAAALFVVLSFADDMQIKYLARCRS